MTKTISEQINEMPYPKHILDEMKKIFSAIEKQHTTGTINPAVTRYEMDNDKKHSRETYKKILEGEGFEVTYESNHILKIKEI